MGTRTSIGIYIGAGDKDIAAWFNLLSRNNMSRSKWVRGLLAAYSLNQPLRIGIVDKKAPLIDDPDNPSDTVSLDGPFKYGWHVKGPNGEFVIGSVVNLSIRNDEIKETLDEAWENGHMLAPFIKSLIRKNLKTADKEVPPRIDDLNRVWADFLVSINSKATKRRKNQSLDKPSFNPDPKPDTSWVTEGDEPVLAKDTPKPVPKSERSFSFGETGEQPSPNFTSVPQPSLGKNPLLSQI